MIISIFAKHFANTPAHAHALAISPAPAHAPAPAISPAPAVAPQL
jgi:hypothetical protein